MECTTSSFILLIFEAVFQNMRQIKEDSNAVWGYNLQIILKWEAFLSSDQTSFSKRNNRYPENVTWDTSVGFESGYPVFNWEDHLNIKYYMNMWEVLGTCSFHALS